MKQPETLWIIVILFIVSIITALVMHSIGLENEVEQLQEENMILMDQIWSMNQHLTDEGVDVNE